MSSASPFPVCAAVLFSLGVLGGIGNAAAAGWTVTFDQEFVASTGQAPTDSWSAKISPLGPDGPAALLAGKGRLTYPSTDKSGATIIPPVSEKIEFDFYPEPGRHVSYSLTTR